MIIAPTTVSKELKHHTCPQLSYPLPCPVPDCPKGLPAHAEGMAQRNLMAVSGRSVYRRVRRFAIDGSAVYGWEVTT